MGTILGIIMIIILIAIATHSQRDSPCRSPCRAEPIPVPVGVIGAPFRAEPIPVPVGVIGALISQTCHLVPKRAPISLSAYRSANHSQTIGAANGWLLWAASGADWR
jgi:hypothetical protein